MVTNTVDSAITGRCDAVVDLAAEAEVGAVACRSYQNTLVLLLALEAHLAGTDTSAVVATVEVAAEASAHLIHGESDWLPDVYDLVLGPAGPRLPAVGCETGDWSHVDVYSTKTTDYRLIVFAGSPWEPQLAEWTTARGSTVVGVGGSVPGARHEVRYPGESDDDVRLLTEVLVPELLAARAWQRTATD